MKKKFLVGLLSAAMVATMLTGCGKKLIHQTIQHQQQLQLRKQPLMRGLQKQQQTMLQLLIHHPQVIS
ncbi:hypothetical protein [Anaerocolumna sedimenticola]|uniref:hypothetical protein n=1 Tax=Anaerocolumna sedimenticola TaxID=2696063 RepID=UPI002ED23562